MTEAQNGTREVLYHVVEVAAKAQHDHTASGFGAWEEQPESYKARMRYSVLPVATAVAQAVHDDAPPALSPLDRDILDRFDSVATALRLTLAVIDGDLPREDLDEDAAEGVRITEEIAVRLRDERRAASSVTPVTYG